MAERFGQFLINHGIVDEAAVLESLNIQKKIKLNPHITERDKLLFQEKKLVPVKASSGTLIEKECRKRI